MIGDERKNQTRYKMTDAFVRFEKKRTMHQYGKVEGGFGREEEGGRGKRRAAQNQATSALGWLVATVLGKGGMKEGRWSRRYRGLNISSDLLTWRPPDSPAQQCCIV